MQIPVYSNKEKDNLQNYRPISLLPAFSKILEKVIYKRLYAYFKAKKLFFDSQYGFRENHSTELAVIEFQDLIIKNIKNKLTSLGIFLDLSKAFDTLQHDILMDKLKHYGVRGQALKWFESYLSNRYQTVNISDCSSEKCNITCGVPQGSILGPLLFLIYLNDLPNVSNLAKFISFADDTTIVYSNPSIETLQTLANNDLKLINNWFKWNKLSLNISKTKCIVFDSKYKLQHLALNNFTLQIDHTYIERVTEMKFLGMILQNDLSWTSHINEKCKKISQVLAIMTKLKHELPSNTLKTIYNALIEPHLNYGLIVWANPNQNATPNRPLLLQKRALRIINKEKYNSHTDPLFKSSKLLKLPDLYKLKCSVLFHKKIKNILPNYHRSQLLTRAEYMPNNRPTRQQRDIYIHSTTTNLDKRLLNYAVGTIWNTLSDSIKSKNHLSKGSFSKHLKNHLLSQYSATV